MPEFRDILMSRETFRFDQTHDVLLLVRKNFRFVHDKQIRYFNVPCAFDIETSSWKDDLGNKCACMYVWQLCVYGAVIVGRTWDEYVACTDALAKELDLDPERKRLLIYVHNLGFEFQFMCRHFTFTDVFASKPREPMKAVTSQGIEYRCSYILSGSSLAFVGDHLSKYPIKKRVGDLKYDLIRTPETQLTQQELDYATDDVRVVTAYIMEEIERNNNNIAMIPLTKTGYVRRFVRNSCFYVDGKPKAKSKKRMNYRAVIKNLTLKPDEYKQLKRAFQGGFTHANPFNANKVIMHVSSYDVTSSYPAVMMAEQFPMSPAEAIIPKSEADFRENLNMYCCIFDLTLFDVSPKLFQDNPISRSRCTGVKNDILNNGRVVYADELTITVTETDYKILEHFYKWRRKEVRNFRRYKKAFLPKDFVKAILKLYEDKTKLKGVKGREEEYLIAKEMLNACYGMAVTDIVRDREVYDNVKGWKTEKVNLAEELDKYNADPNRFLFYAWGVWVTAYARRNLFIGILEAGTDYVYADTDSIKITNAKQHQYFLETYNDAITKQIRHALEYQGIDPDAAAPETITGKKKPIGIWDDDGFYKAFKTLGAKRYLGWHGGDDYLLTVAGLGKTTALSWMLRKYGKIGIFREFQNNLTVPASSTGKLIHAYIDSPVRCYITDCYGKTSYIEELSYIYLEQCDYHMGLDQFLMYLKGIIDE